MGFFHVYLTVQFRSLWIRFVGGIWENLEKQPRKALECCKESLMGRSGGYSEGQNANRNVERNDCAHMASNRNKDSFGD
jgi:hypothetical protein